MQANRDSDSSRSQIVLDWSATDVRLKRAIHTAINVRRNVAFLIEVKRQARDCGEKKACEPDHPPKMPAFR